MGNALLFSSDTWITTPVGSVAYALFQDTAQIILFNPIIVATQYVVATWIFSSKSNSTRTSLWTIGILMTLLLYILNFPFNFYHDLHRLWAYKDYNPETGVFCEQDSKFEANNIGLEYNKNQITCGELSKYLKNNTTDWQEIGDTILEWQPSCCDGESRYSADMNATLHNVYKYGYPIVSLLGWAVFFLALWSKQIIGNKDNADETIEHGMQDIPPNAVATLPNDDADETISHGMQDIPPNAVATLPDDVEAQPTDASSPHHNEKDLKKEPIHYFTNIKIFLTCLVICLHCIAMLTYNPNDNLGIGFYINLEWFKGLPVRSEVGYTLMSVYSAIFNVFAMSLFFFISGFFVVRSFDKKKKSAFLFDRFKRMGIPSVCYAFIFGPYLTYAMSGWLMIGEYIPTIHQPVNIGVTWFLNTLLLFNVAYAYLCGEGWTVNIKFSVRTIFLSTTAVGIVEAVIRLFINEGDHVFGIHRFFYAGCMYVLVFWGGAIAYRNDWMSGIKNMSGITKIALYACCIINTIAMFLRTWYGKHGFHKWMSTQSYGVQSLINILLSAFILDQGAPTALWMLSITTFFMDRMNFEIETFSLTKTLSKAA